MKIAAGWQTSTYPQPVCHGGAFTRSQGTNRPRFNWQPEGSSGCQFGPTQSDLILFRHLGRKALTTG